MIKVSVMYPNSPGARFDHEYYRDKHMPLLKARMGSSCEYYTVDKGLAGGTPRGSRDVRCDVSHLLRLGRGVSMGLFASRAGDHGRYSELHRRESRGSDQ